MSTINYLTTVQLDFGAINLLPDELARLNIKKPLLITDKGICSSGLDQKVILAMKNPNVVIFDGTPPNPTQRAVEEATRVYLENHCDGIVSLGGGSSIDLSKATALLATHPGPLEQYAFLEGGAAKITAKIAPLIAIPTTAGTGSEVGRGALIIMESGRKLSIISPNIFPKVAICDPELTLGLPPYLTAATGMDAITHCIETYLSPLVNPPADAIALDGLERGIKYVKKATDDGQDREARWNMMVAAMEGAMAFQKGLGAVHALSHPLGAMPQSFHHGTLNAILLPAVLRFNMPVVIEKFKKLATVMGLNDYAKIPEFIQELNFNLKLPKGLGEIGFSRNEIETISIAATKDHCHTTNARIATIAEYRQILEESY